MYNLRELIGFIEAPERLAPTIATIDRYLVDPKFKHKRERYGARLAQLQAIQQLLPHLSLADFEEVRRLLVEERKALRRGEPVKEIRQRMEKTPLAQQILAATAVEVR